MNPKVLNLIETVGPIVKEQWDKAWSWLQKQFKETDWEEMFRSLVEKAEGKVNELGIPEGVTITPVEVEMLTKEKLVEIAKQNIVPNSNQVAATINDKSSNVYYVYLAYVKDRTLLPNEENNFVIIKADGLNKEALNLFADNELIILK